MFKKLTLISLSALLLGGCTLLDVFKPSDAAKDINKEVVASSTPTPAPPDPNLEAIPSPKAENDVTSLETDINSTVILDEDFSDLN